MLPAAYRLSPLAIAACLAISGAAYAQTATAPDTAATTAADAVLPTVTVNASADASADGLPAPFSGGQVARGGRVGLFGNQNIMNTPFTITNYTQELIQNQQAHSVADVLQNDPSVRMARGFGNFQETYIIRGFPIDSDDMAYNGLYGILPRQYVAAELLERVEVMRGANSFVNGVAPNGGGLGGSINLVPKRAGSSPLTQVTAGVESGGQGYLATDISRRFGPDERFGIRLNAVRRDGDTAVSGEHRELNVVALGLDYNGGNFRVSADLGYQENKMSGLRPNVTINSGLRIPAPPSVSGNYAQPWTYSNERDQFGTLRAELDLTRDVTAWAAYGVRKSVENNSLSNLTVSNAAGDASGYRADNHRRDTVMTGEVGIRAKVDTGPVGHTFSLAASNYWLDSRNSYAWSLGGLGGTYTTNLYNPISYSAPLTNGYAGGDMNNPLTTHTTRLSSVALADTLSFAQDTVLVTVGARNQNIKDYSYDYNSGAENGRYSDSAVTPMAGIVFKPIDHLSIYANYIEGLTKGDTAPSNAINSGQIFAPYKTKQKEVGVKYELGNLGLSAAAFTTAKPSGLLNAASIYSIDGEQRNRGLEFSAFGTVARGIRVLGGLTILDAKLTSTAGGANDGKNAIGVPRQQVNLGGEWDIPGVQGLTVTGRAVYTSTQYADAANTQQLPSWTRFDGGVRYITGFGVHAITIRGRVDNLLNKNYWASAGGYPGYGYLVQGAPRTFGLTATMDF